MAACSTCGGSGRIIRTVGAGRNKKQVVFVCNRCGGSGQM